ncbi:MAG: Flp pilus assembly complex ATPase component TadA [Candidatus Kerfeldbacteria bacterium]|nr:Flp pilus assembly complex ATPase component TadA [Candidatus Kerfeldbacteria bacterium]
MPSKPKVTLATSEVKEKFAAKMQELGLKEKERETEDRAHALGLPYLNLKGVPVSQDALELIPEDRARELNLAPILISGREVRLGVINHQQPGLKEYLAELELKHPGHYALYLISPASLELVLKLYKGLAKTRVITTGVSITEADLQRFQGVMKDFTKVNDMLRQASATDFVTAVIAGALEMRSSDIHVEAEETDVKVRYRIDGVLHAVAEVPRASWPKIIARFKLLAKLKLNIDNQPQDGRFTIYLIKDKVDVRVSTIPTAYGESVVMRLLKSSAASLEFEQLGLRGKAYEDLKREVERPNGMIITTGPTGSGKTTTLYAVLNKLNDAETKIITLEDPVEYKLKGINQSQIDHAAGYDFAKGLKAILRQDPDVVMVGEIRDFETADIAINAALTGHLVISTIHTNSAAGAIPRFLAMGVKPFLLAPAMNCIIGQRLVRKICDQCKKETKLEPDVLERVKKILSEISPVSGYKIDMNNLHFFHGQGCEACNKLGYKGRIGIYEILPMNQEIEKIILSGQVSEYVLQDIGVKNGMVLMVQDGLLKALDGITSVAEIFEAAE